LPALARRIPTLNQPGAALLARLLCLVLLLLAVPASAANLQFKDCSPGQQKELTETVADLQQQLGYVLGWLREGKLRPYVQAWFGPLATEREVDDALSAIQARPNSQTPLVFTCAAASICKPEVMGFAGAHETSLCPDFFARPRRDGNETQIGMLVHELSHLVLNTHDYLYGRAQVRALAAQRPALALKNADNYQYFIETVLNPDVYGALPQGPENACLFAFDGSCDEGARGRFICTYGTDTADCTYAPTPQQSSGASNPFGQSLRP
jgi:hypothetical protein